MWDASVVQLEASRNENSQEGNSILEFIGTLLIFVKWEMFHLSCWQGSVILMESSTYRLIDSYNSAYTDRGKNVVSVATMHHVPVTLKCCRLIVQGYSLLHMKVGGLTYLTVKHDTISMCV